MSGEQPFWSFTNLVSSTFTHWQTFLRVVCATLVVVAALCAPLMPGVAWAGKVAPPVSPEVVAACEQEVQASLPTADVRQRVHNTVVLGGCLADGGSGIAHAYLEWHDEESDGRGRICTDPAVVNSAWQCEWDTTVLPPGNYTVHFVALDDAGNRGTFDRLYQVERTPAEREPATGDPVDPSPDATTTDTPESMVDPLLDDRNAVIDLALARMDACARNEVESAPTNDPDTVSQVEQAALVATCVEPALATLGAASVIVDALPVPPVVVIQVSDHDDLARLADLLPAEVAGVPIAIELVCERDTSDPCRAS
jgi:hypothetical protein